MTIPGELVNAARSTALVPFAPTGKFCSSGRAGAFGAGDLSFLASGTTFWPGALSAELGELHLSHCHRHAERLHRHGNRAHVLAGVMISIFPVLIFFLLAQRFVIRGIAMTGLKG